MSLVFHAQHVSWKSTISSFDCLTCFGLSSVFKEIFASNLMSFICLFSFHWHECAPPCLLAPLLFLRGHHPLSLFSLHPNIKRNSLSCLWLWATIGQNADCKWWKPHPSWCISKTSHTPKAQRKLHKSRSEDCKKQQKTRMFSWLLNTMVSSARSA